jgi:hypothetical protein
MAKILDIPLPSSALGAIDDAVALASRQFGFGVKPAAVAKKLPSIPAVPSNPYMDIKNGDSPFHGPFHSLKPSAKPHVSIPKAPINPLDGVINAGGVIEGVVGKAMFADIGISILGGGLGLIGLKAAQEKVKKPITLLKEKNLSKNITAHSALMDGSFVLTSALGTLAVVRSFDDKMESLKLMYADMAGKDVKHVTKKEALTADAPPAVIQARDHLKKEHGSRFAAQLVGLGMSIRGLLKGGGMAGMLSFAVPMIANAGIDMYMGESPVLHVYKGISDAYKAGEDIPVASYAEFITAASPTFKNLGKAHAITLEVAERLHDQGISPVKILKMAESKELEKMGDLVVDGKTLPAIIDETPKPAKLDDPYAKILPKGLKYERPVVGDGKFTGGFAQKNGIDPVALSGAWNER